MYHIKVCLVGAVWPLSNSSNVQLMGLFEDDFNSSDPSSSSAQFRALFKAAVILSHKYNITVNGQLIGWHIEQTSGKVIDSLRSTCLAVLKSNVVGIVGPGSSQEAHTIAVFADTIGIPIVSYTATDPDLSSRSMYPAFYRTIPSDTSAALAIVQLFIRYNWTSCIVIYQNDAYGYSGMRVINDAFVKKSFKVREMIKFDIATHTIQGNLRDYLLNSGARIVVLWAMPIFTSIILQHALDHDLLGPRFLWILSSSLPLNSVNQESSRKFVGMLTVEPASGSVLDASINASLLKAAYEVWQQHEPESFPGENNVDQYALFAFDATWLLIQSLQRLCTKTTKRASVPCISFVDSSLCFDRRLVDTSSFFDQITSTAFLGVTGSIEYMINGTDRSDGIYYFAQNIQLSSKGLNFVPVLKYSEQESWEKYNEPGIIIWPNNSCIVPSDHPVLADITLRIGIIRLDPFTMVEYVQDELGQNRTKSIGYVPDLIELLREKMNFIPNISFTPVNRPYLEYINSVVNGTYDILIGDVTVTANRRELVSFSISILDTSLSVVIRKPMSIDVDLFSYMRPFSTGLWIIILATIFYASILLCFLERRINVALRDRSIASIGTMSIWYCFGTIMGYGVDFHAATASGRLLTAALYMLSLILVATYTANLASNLTKSMPRYIINGIDDIKKEKLPSNRIGHINGSAMEQYYVQEISRESRNFFSAKNLGLILDSLLDGTIDATFLDSSVADYLTNNIYCNLTVVGSTFNDVAFGIVMPNHWPYAHDLDRNILLLRESGKLDRLRRKWFLTGNCDATSERLNAVQVESMAGLFLIFGIITVLPLLPFLWRKCLIIKSYFYTIKRRTNIVSQEKNLSTQQPNSSSQ